VKVFGRLYDGRSSTRRWRDGGTAAWIGLACAFFAQFAFVTHQLPRSMALTAPPPAPSAKIAELASFGDPLPFAHLIALALQAFENQAGANVRFEDLDYGVITSWLAVALKLDPMGQYPLLLAAHVYAQVPDPGRQRAMLEFVRTGAAQDLSRRWHWLAHASLMARHRLKDPRLALALASDLASAPAAILMPGWARQMAVFLHEDLGEREAARRLLGGLLASGMVSDASEFRFLAQRLEALQSDEYSASTSVVQRRGEVHR